MAVVASHSPNMLLYRELCHRRRDHHQQLSHPPSGGGGSGGGGGAGCSSAYVFGVGLSTALGSRRTRGEPPSSRGDQVKAGAFWQKDVSPPTSVEMEAIADNEQLDLILRHSQELSQPVVIDWMASWCRKCIYLKPKLEKLAAEYHSKLKFYYVDVNSVSQVLVKRGNISKMPTIQLWKDGEMREEIIGGHKAWLVIDEVREMIRKNI